MTVQSLAGRMLRRGRGYRKPNFAVESFALLLRISINIIPDTSSFMLRK